MMVANLSLSFQQLIQKQILLSQHMQLTAHKTQSSATSLTEQQQATFFIVIAGRGVNYTLV